MKFLDLLTSGVQFDESEENLEFRFRFLSAITLIAAFSALAFVLLDWLGINNLGYVQLTATEALAAVQLMLSWYLRGRKHAYTVCAWILILTAYLVFTSSLINEPQDELRVIWYYVVVVCAYMLLSKVGGIVITLGAILAVTVAKFALGIFISDNAFTTFLISLMLTSGIAYASTSLVNSYAKRMADNLVQLRDLASKDPLTGLWNARAYYEISNKLIQLAQRDKNPFCTLFIDLDHFKSINDKFGHETGDAVLRAVAECLSGNSRESDVVGRIGGEEFVVFLPNTGEQGALQLAEKLCRHVEALPLEFPGNNRRNVTLSIGVAQNRSSDITIADIQKRADEAMYAAKQQGRNRAVMFSRAV
jgi:diguanylate cyclase (GGDEF)-like protein